MATAEPNTAEFKKQRQRYWSEIPKFEANDLRQETVNQNLWINQDFDQLVQSVRKLPEHIFKTNEELPSEEGTPLTARKL